MGLTFSELKRRVTLGMEALSPEATLVIEQSINDAVLAICTVIDLPDLFVTDTTNAATVASQKIYSLTTDWGLTRPKDLFSLILVDSTNSRELGMCRGKSGIMRSLTPRHSLRVDLSFTRVPVVRWSSTASQMLPTTLR